MTNQRILLIGGSSPVRCNIRRAGMAMVEVCDELDPILREIGYVNSAPFAVVSLILRYGLRTDLKPIYQRINLWHRSLPVTVVLEMAKLQSLDRDGLKREFLIASLCVLIDVAKRFDLPYAAFSDRLALVTT